MYNSFYKLNQHPFRLTPDPAFLYMTTRHREALAGLVYSICNRSGLTILVGEAGTGKTTLLHALRDWLTKRHYVTAFCTNPTLTREEFFDLLLTRLHIDCPSSLKSRQLLALEENLPRYQSAGRRPVLIVDEAHELPRELLEEIRLLLNLESPQGKCLDIILAGQPELIHVLGRPDLRQLKQRVSCYCRVGPLTPQEVKEYVQHRLTRAGMPQQTLFPDETIAAISACSKGIPRVVSILCDSALQTGFALQTDTITVSIVHEVAKDLDLFPDGDPQTHSHADTPMLVDETVDAPRSIATPTAISHGANDGTTYDVASISTRIPMESYISRQKSLGFLASLVGRWT